MADFLLAWCKYNPSAALIKHCEAVQWHAVKIDWTSIYLFIWFFANIPGRFLIMLDPWAENAFINCHSNPQAKRAR